MEMQYCVVTTSVEMQYCVVTLSVCRILLSLKRTTNRFLFIPKNN